MMAAEDQDSRTEDPTSKRQTEALKKGNVAVSREVGLAAMLAAALAVFLIILPWSMRPLFALMRGLVEQPQRISLATPADIRALGLEIAFATATALAPAMALFALTGIASTVLQLGRMLWATDKLKPQWEMLNPVRGFQRLFSGRALVEWAKGLAKLLLVTTVTLLVLEPEFGRIELMIGLTPGQIMVRLGHDLATLLIAAFLAIGALAVGDFFYQRWSHWRSLKMTKQEVKDEVKNQDGDPTIKAKQQARRRARARQRMLQAVPKASVVVTNPTHYAVALSYRQGMNAPKLVAKGVDFLARRIRDVAEEHKVPVVENPPVARALYAAVEVDDEIPPEHYKAVAEIIGYVMRLEKLKKSA